MRIENRIRYIKGFIVAGILACLLICCNGCMPTDQGQGRIALKVDGQALPASVLEEYIGNIKNGLGADTDAAFETYVSSLGQTMQEYWDSLIDFYATEMAAIKKCDELGIEATTEEIDEKRKTYWSYLGVTSEDQYPQRLEDAGLSEAEVDSRFVYTIRLNKLYESEVEHPIATEEQMQEYADDYADSLDAVSYQYLYMSAGNLAQMQDILKTLTEDPDADLDALAREYSESPTVQEDSGKSGWMPLSMIDERFAEQLSGLEVGEICADVFIMDDNLYIIKKTGEYQALPEGQDQVDLTSMPDDLKERLREDVEKEEWNKACQEYLRQLLDEAHVEVLINSYYDLETADE